MLKITDKFNFPQINEFRKEYLIKDQQYFWFLPKNDIIHTELCDIEKDENNYKFSNFKHHQPYTYISTSNLEEDIKSYNLWGITNNDSENYYDLKINSDGIFYNQLQNDILSYKIIFKTKEKEIYLIKSNLKFIQACLYKEGHAFLSTSSANPMSLDNFIVGLLADLNINEKNKIHFEINAIISNSTKQYYPQFSISINPNYSVFGTIKIDSIVKYEKTEDSNEELQEFSPNCTTTLKFSSIGII